MPRSRDAVRIALGCGLAAAGIAHLVVPRAFLTHLPPALPARETLVLVTGLAEIALGAALIAAPRRQRALVGAVTAAYLCAVFPANVYAALAETAYPERWMGWLRLPLQVPLIAGAWWSTRPSPEGHRDGQGPRDGADATARRRR